MPHKSESTKFSASTSSFYDSTIRCPISRPLASSLGLRHEHSHPSAVENGILCSSPIELPILRSVDWQNLRFNG